MGLTAKTYTYKDEIVDIIIRKMHAGSFPEGVNPIITNGVKTITKTFYGPDKYSLVTYTDGWTGGVPNDKYQKDFSVGEVKSEFSFSAQTYLNSVQSKAADIQRKWQNDVLQAEMKEMIDLITANMDIRGIESEAMAAAAELLVFIDPFAKSAYYAMMLGNTAKVTLEGDGSTTKFPNGTAYSKYAADIRFNAFNGLWKNIFDNASTSPTTSQIQKVAFAKGATSQSNALTLSGSAGTATISFKGVSKTATYSSSLTATASAFVTANLAAYAAVGVTISSSDAVLTFVNNEAGVTIDAATATNLTENLSGANVTTAATAASALANNDCQTELEAAWAVRPAVMRNIPKEDMVALVTSNLWDNYEKTLRGNGTIVVESQRGANINGAMYEAMKWNGIQLHEMPIDNIITSYFGGYAPYRIILTPRWNIAPIFSSAEKAAQLSVWFEKKDNANLGRAQAAFGCDLWLPEYAVVVY